MTRFDEVPKRIRWFQNEFLQRLALYLTLVLSSVLLSGCARHYVMKLNTGAEVDAFGKPKLRDGAYYYRDARGTNATLPASRVIGIQPASMAEEERKALEPPKPPKKRHWYYLWLAGNSSSGDIEPTQQA
jgi:hypothetical protein